MVSNTPSAKIKLPIGVTSLGQLLCDFAVLHYLERDSHVFPVPRDKLISVTQPVDYLDMPIHYANVPDCLGGLRLLDDFGRTICALLDGAANKMGICHLAENVVDLNCTSINKYPLIPQLY